MQDVIRHDIIPRAPLEWLSVSKTCRTWALDSLHKVADVAPYGHEFWCIVGLLHDNGRRHRIAAFTEQYFDVENDSLGEWIEKILRITIHNEACYDITEVMKYYRFIDYLDESLKLILFDNAIAWISLEDAVDIYRLMKRIYIELSMDLEYEINDMLYDPYCFGNVDHGDALVKVIRFVVDYFPDIIHEYATYYLNRRMSREMKNRILVVCDEARDLLHESVIKTLRARCE